MTTIHLADNLRRLRARMKLSQEALARQLEITRGRYAKYEDRTSEPPLQILITLARFHQVSIDELLQEKLPRQEPT